MYIPRWWEGWRTIWGRPAPAAYGSLKARGPPPGRSKRPCSIPAGTCARSSRPPRARRTSWRAPTITRSRRSTAITRHEPTWRTPPGRWRRSTESRHINPWIIAFTVMLATFMEVLDTSVANVALPHIAGNLSASTDVATWVLTSYLVANAIILPMGGWFSMLMGRKRFYMICVALFTISSFLCGLAPTLGSLIFFRVLQGIGGGALQPMSQAILVETFPREKQGMAMAVFGMGVVLAPVIGPTLGGWLTDDFSWRWIFFINIPVGVLSLLMTKMLVFDPQYLVRRSFRDGLKIYYMGFGLLALGLGSLEVVLDEGQKEDWFSSQFIVGFAIVAAVCLVWVVFWELRHEHPVIDFRVLKIRNFM